MSKQKNREQIRRLKAIRGVERKQHFENGGDLVSWRGGTRTVTIDRKKKQNKKACRGKWH